MPTSDDRSARHGLEGQGRLVVRMRRRGSGGLDGVTSNEILRCTRNDAMSIRYDQSRDRPFYPLFGRTLSGLRAVDDARAWKRRVHHKSTTSDGDVIAGGVLNLVHHFVG